MRVRELPVQARLADARVADNRDDLAVPAARLLQSLAQLLELAVAADKAREAPDGSSV